MDRLTVEVEIVQREYLATNQIQVQVEPAVVEVTTH